MARVRLEAAGTRSARKLRTGVFYPEAKEAAFPRLDTSHHERAGFRSLFRCARRVDPVDFVLRSPRMGRDVCRFSDVRLMVQVLPYLGY